VPKIKNIYNLKLKSFVEKKQKVLDEFGVSEPRYFVQEDIDDLMAWTPKDAKRVWDQLADYINGKNCAIGLQDTHCPWCILNESDCRKCTYRDNHEACGHWDVSNDYDIIVAKIKQQISDMTNGSGSVYFSLDPFSVEVYRKLIKEVDTEFPDE